MVKYIPSIKFNRLISLLKYELFFNSRNIGICGFLIFGVLLIINISSISFEITMDFNAIFFPITLLLCGTIITFIIFSDLRRINRSYQYITLPCSMLEKYLSKLLLTSLGLLLSVICAFFLFSIIAAGINQFFFGNYHPLFNPSSYRSLLIIELYLAIHGIVFFGIVYSNSIHLLKTTLVVLGSGTILIFIQFMFIIIFFGQYIQFENYFKPLTIIYLSKDNIETLNYLFWFLLIPSFWITGYIRFSETEV